MPVMKLQFFNKYQRAFHQKKHYHTSSYNSYPHVKINALKVWTVTAVLASVCLMVYLYRTNFGYCDEKSLGRTVQNICNQYYRKQSSGPFCETICAKEIYLNQRPEDRTKGYYCPSRDASKNIHLIGTTGDGYNYYLKEAQVTSYEHEGAVHLEPISWVGKDGRLNYPTEEEFLQIVNSSIFFHYNRTMSENKIKELLNYKQNGSFQRLYNFMDNIWRLIHDNDFMMAHLGHSELFPRVLGYCGPFYATEYIQPFKAPSHLDRLSVAERRDRLQKAILIMDYVEEVSAAKISMCDLRYSLFGRQDSSIKYLSLANVHPEYFIDRLLSDLKPCWKDIHCSHKHCRSKCDKTVGKCSQPQMNNNYQGVCEMLRGTAYSPGLLVGRVSPKFLQLVERCAEPKVSFDQSYERPMGPTKHLFDQLRAEIINMYDGLINA